MEHWIASIFHVTDLHLFIDEQGAERPLGERHVTVQALESFAKRIRLRAVEDLVGGFSLPDMEAWTALLVRLPALVASERARANREPEHLPIIVLQTGDVETFGHLPAERASAGRRDPYSGFRFLHQTLWPRVRAAGADAIIDLFGNHDFTPVEHVRNACSRMATAPGLSGPWPDRHEFAAPADVRLEVYRLNSVAPLPLLAAVASGSIGPHPRGQKLPLTKGTDALAELFHQTRAPARVAGTEPVRILAMHHPPHFFRGSLSARLTSGRLVESDAVASCAEYSRIHLVMAGHRHELDPPEGTTYDGRSPVPNQLPFNGTRGQLVSESPTARSSVKPRAGGKSMSVFRLYLDDDRNTLRVARAVLVYRDGATQFAAYAWENVFVEIPL
jgi:hypothetical protein